jgi:hypothetical protein
MDYEAIEDVGALSEGEYGGLVDWVKEHFAELFRAAQGDAQKVQHVVAAYRAFGEKVKLTRGELIDFLRADTPNILEMAGYSEAEGNTAMAFFDEDPDGPASPADG